MAVSYLARADALAWSTEGGIRCPSIIAYPGSRNGSVTHEFTTVMDILPTVVSCRATVLPLECSRPSLTSLEYRTLETNSAAARSCVREASPGYRTFQARRMRYTETTRYTAGNVSSLRLVSRSS